MGSEKPEGGLRVLRAVQRMLGVTEDLSNSSQKGAKPRYQAMKTGISENSKELSADQQALFRACERGNVTKVKQLINENNDWANIRNSDRKPPLSVVINNDHEELIPILVKYSKPLIYWEGLLEALQERKSEIAEIMIEDPRYAEVSALVKDMVEKGDICEVGRFQIYESPIMLASASNDFNLVSMLLQKHEYIPKPHAYGCSCERCSNSKMDKIEQAKARLGTYKSLTSEAYICYTTPDPIMAAFNLRHELLACASKEPYYRNEYEELADELSGLAVDFLDHVASGGELNAVLDKTANEKSTVFKSLDRLELAVKREEKKFVAHPSCQQRLTDIWYSDMRFFDKMTFTKQLLFILTFIAFYPLLAINYVLWPTSQLALMMEIPFIKCLGWLLSYISFIILLFISSLGVLIQPDTIRDHTKIYEQYKQTMEEAELQYVDNFALRQSFPAIIYWILMIYVVGYIVKECSEIKTEGFWNYIGSTINFIDFLNLTCYITSFVIRIVVNIKADNARNFFEHENSWPDLLTNDHRAEIHFYYLRADRWYWAAADPSYIAEALFAVANVLTFGKFTGFLSISEGLGPMYCSLIKMIKDIMSFSGIFILIWVAFWMGMYNLYWPFQKGAEESYKYIEHKFQESTAEKKFAGVTVALGTVFWGLFGMADVESSSLENFGETTPDVTMFFGEILFAIYNIIMVLMLLNMLIAMMSQSYEVVAENSDMEWKFARTSLYLAFIADPAVLGSPFNLIPNLKHLVMSIKNSCNLARKKRQYERTVIQLRNINGLVIDVKDVVERKRKSPRNGVAPPFANDEKASNRVAEDLEYYQSVIHQIVRRFVADRVTTEQSATSLTELKSDISSVRFEVQEAMEQQRQTLESLVEKVDQLTFHTTMPTYPTSISIRDDHGSVY